MLLLDMRGGGGESDLPSTRRGGHQKSWPPSPRTPREQRYNTTTMALAAPTRSVYRALVRAGNSTFHGEGKPTPQHRLAG